VEEEIAVRSRGRDLSGNRSGIRGRCRSRSSIQ
jgi:hypothetical protein